jgi:hypothetical protein
MTRDYDSLRHDAEDALRAARHRLDADIAAYPAPISGCDAQFNHLLAERRRLARALSALQADVFIPTPRMPMQGTGIESR